MGCSDWTSFAFSALTWGICEGEKLLPYIRVTGISFSINASPLYGVHSNYALIALAYL